MPDEVPTSPNSHPPTFARFARILLTMGSGESLWLIVAFIMGVIALGVLSNFIYTLALTPADATWEGLARVTIVLASCCVLAYLAFHRDQQIAWRTRKLTAAIDESRLVEPHAGLIVLLSPGAINLPWLTIQWHYTAPPDKRLQHCWALITPDAQDAFDRLQARLQENGCLIDLHPVLLPASTIEATYHTVDNIYERARTEQHLEPYQIVADLTGGFKTMTAGMVMACLPYGRLLEYTESRRDQMGQYIEGTQRVIQVGVDFALSS